MPGGSFGEVALSIPGQARTASIVASERCAAWRLSSAAYQEEITAQAQSQEAEAEEAKNSPARGGWRDRRAKERHQPSQRERGGEPRAEAQSHWRSSSEEREATSLAGSSDGGEKWRAPEEDSDDASADHRRSGRRDPQPRRSSRRGRSRSLSGDESELSLSSDDSGTDSDGRGPSRLERKLLHALHEERQLRRALEKRVEKLERQVAAAFPEAPGAMARQGDDRDRPSRSGGESRDRDRGREKRSAGKSKDKERSSSRARSHRSSRR